MIKHSWRIKMLFFNRIILQLLLIVLLGKSAIAVQLPRVISSEKRFRAYIYNPNEVYRYVGYYLSQSYIEFEEGETVQSISMGDTTAWQTIVMDNKLFLKPIDQFPATNMTVMTNKRTYFFELDAVNISEGNLSEMLFYVKFMYPDSGKDKNIVVFNTTKRRNDKPDLRDISKYNFNYEFSGSPNIAPVKVFDDGEFTFMEFRNQNVEIPAIFVVDSSGYEGLVNFRIVENYIVVEQTASQFTLRSGDDIVCVYNNSLYNIKRY